MLQSDDHFFSRTMVVETVRFPDNASRTEIVWPASRRRRGQIPEEALGMRKGLPQSDESILNGGAFTNRHLSLLLKCGSSGMRR